jgi:hypothetical protein
LSCIIRVGIDGIDKHLPGRNPVEL